MSVDPDLFDGGALLNQPTLDEEYAAIRSLWAAVLHLVLMDFQYGLRRQITPPPDPFHMPDISARAKLRRQERIYDWERYYTTAKAWLHSRNETIGSFLWICEVLELDPVRVTDAAYDPNLFDRIKHREERVALSEGVKDDDEEAVAGYVEHHVGEFAGGGRQGAWEEGASPDEGGGDGLDQLGESWLRERDHQTGARPGAVEGGTA